MTEGYRSSIEAIIAQEQLKRTRAEEAVGSAEHQLVAGAKEAVKLHSSETEQLIPHAQESFRMVIEPWVLELQRSGVYGGIMDILNGSYPKPERIVVSDPVEYTDPWEAFVVIDFYEPKPRKSPRRGTYHGIRASQFILEGTVDQEALAKQVEKFKNETWVAQLAFEQFSKLSIIRYPKEHPEYAVHDFEHPRIYIPPFPLATEAANTFPRAIIGLAEQVQSERVWEVIDSSLKQGR